MLFLIGLLTSVHCIAMCGGINLSQCIGNTDKSFRSAIAYNAGRVLSYTGIGFVLGLIGSLAGGDASVGIPVTVQGGLKLFAGALMVLMGINMLNLFPALRKLTLRIPKGIAARVRTRKVGSSAFVVGLLNGFMPCGPLQSMQIVALASGSPVNGAMSMLIFSLGTVSTTYARAWLYRFDAWAEVCRESNDSRIGTCYGTWPRDAFPGQQPYRISVYAFRN